MTGRQIRSSRGLGGGSATQGITSRARAATRRDIALLQIGAVGPALGSSVADLAESVRSLTEQGDRCAIGHDGQHRAAGRRTGAEIELAVDYGGGRAGGSAGSQPLARGP